MKSISINAQYLRNGKIENEITELTIKSNSAECTLLEWSKLEKLLAQNADFLSNPITDINTYQRILIDAISIFVVNGGKDLAINLQSLPIIDSGVDSLNALFEMVISNVRSYKPMQIASGQPFLFEHRGEWFAIPAMFYNDKQITQIGRDLTFLETSEALMADLRFSQKKDNAYIFEHAQYQTSLWILAALCRKVLMDKETNRFVGYESVPSNANEWHDLVMNRVAFFKDVSLEIGLQANFFLQTSNILLKTTPIIRTSTMFRNLQKMLNLARLNGSLVGLVP